MMDKRFKVLAGAFCLLLVLLVTVFLVVSFWDRLFPREAEIPIPGEVTSFRAESASVEEETDKYKIEVRYPRFLNGEKSAKANVALSGKIQPVIDQFKITANEIMGDFPVELKSELDINYEVILLNPRLASVKFVGSEYITGAAHPNNYYLTFNYDFDSQKRLEFSDLFNEESNYLKIVSDRAVADLKNRFEEIYGEGAEANFDWIEDGAGPRIENYEKFSLSQSSLTIYFDPYQVAAYAAGGQEVKISHESISAILKTEIVAAVQ